MENKESQYVFVPTSTMEAAKSALYTNFTALPTARPSSSKQSQPIKRVALPQHLYKSSGRNRCKYTEVARVPKELLLKMLLIVKKHKTLSKQGFGPAKLEDEKNS